MTSLRHLRPLAALLVWAVLALALAPAAPAFAVAERSASTQRPTVHALLPKTLLVASLRNGDERRQNGIFDLPPAILASDSAAPLAEPRGPSAAVETPPRASARPSAYLARAPPA